MKNNIFAGNGGPQLIIRNTEKDPDCVNNISDYNLFDMPFGGGSSIGATGVFGPFCKALAAEGECLFRLSDKSESQKSKNEIIELEAQIQKDRAMLKRDSEKMSRRIVEAFEKLINEDEILLPEMKNVPTGEKAAEEAKEIEAAELAAAEAKAKEEADQAEADRVAAEKAAAPAGGKKK